MNAKGILTNVPDFEHITDIIPLEAEAEIALGTETSILASQSKTVNIIAIIVSALIFLIILSWFDFIQTAFYSYMNPQLINEEIPPSTKFWAAILITFLILMILILFYYYLYC